MEERPIDKFIAYVEAKAMDDLDALTPKDRLNWLLQALEWKHAKLMRANFEHGEAEEITIKIEYGNKDESHEGIQSPVGEPEVD